MNYLTRKSLTPLELTFEFIVLLIISYGLYNLFIRDYGSFLMMISSHIVSYLFDMHVVNGGGYLTDVTLVSNIPLQNSMTHQIAHAELALVKPVVDKIMSVITNTSIILALGMLFVRSLKLLIALFVAMLTLHIVSVTAVLVYFIFEASSLSPILFNYLQALGVTQNVVDISYIFSGVAYHYLKYFTPLAIAYYIWEKEGYSLTLEGERRVKKDVQAFEVIAKVGK